MSANPKMRNSQLGKHPDNASLNFDRDTNPPVSAQGHLRPINEKGEYRG